MPNHEWEAPTDSPESLGQPARRGMAVWLWGALAVLAGALVLYLAFFPSRHETRVGVSHPAVGTRLPSLKLEPLTSGARPLTLADLEGKVVLINYWGTWCGPCRLEFPSLLALEKSLRSEPDFRLLAVSCGESPEFEEEAELTTNTEAFLREANADLPTYSDPQAASRIALVRAAKLDGFAYPTSVLLDRQGTIRAIWSGYAEIFEHEMQRDVRQLLAER